MSDDITRQSYWDEIRSLADDAIEAWRDGDVTYRDGLYDWTHETIDGHQWIIYCECNADVLRYTDNKEAYEEFGGLDHCDGLDAVMVYAAYCAMAADLTAQINAQLDDDEADMRDAIEEQEWETVLDWADCDDSEDVVEALGAIMPRLTRHDTLERIREACNIASD